MSEISEPQYISRTQRAYQDAKVAQVYRDYQTKGLSWMRFAMWRQGSLVEAFLRRLGTTERDWVLDLPCGTGLLAKVFARRRLRILCADISFEMLKLARPDYAAAPRALFYRCDITRIPLQDGCAAGIVTLGLFHRLPPNVRSSAVAEMSRVARDWIVLSFTIDGKFQQLKRKILRRAYRGYLGAPSPGSLCELQRQFEAAGFALVEKKATVPVLSSEVLCLFKRSTP